LCVAVVGASILLEAQALEQARRDAIVRATAYVDEVIAPVLVGRSSTGAFSTDETDALLARIGKRIQDDGVARVRLWSPSGGLLFSTDDEDDSRVDAPAGVSIAGEGSVASALTEESNRRLLQAFVPTPAGDDPTAVAQVDQRYRPIEADVQSSWRTIRLGAGGAAALFLALLLLSFARGGRTKSAAAGFGTPGSGRPARKDQTAPEAKELEKKLEKSEEGRRALEEQLGQLRTQVAGAEARAADRVQVFESQVTEAQSQAKELEALLRDAESRATRTAHEAPFTDAVEERDAPGERVGRLERELAETRSELETSKARLEELEPLVAQSAARVEDAEARANRGTRAADVRAQEAETRADARERRLQVSETRVIELEAFAKDAERRLAASSDAAERTALRIRELEGKLEGARHDNEATLRRAQDAEASLETTTTGEGDGSGRAEEAEARVNELQTRIEDMESHRAQLEELARAAEERAGTARFEADEAIRSQKALESRLEQAQASPAARDTATDERAQIAPDVQQELADAHRAGKEAFKLAGEARAELEKVRAELEAERARVDDAEARTADALARAEDLAGKLEATGWAAPAAGASVSPSEGNGHAEGGSGPDAETPEPEPGQEPNQEPEEESESPDDTDEAEEEGPSLRFRLARSAAQRKGRAKDQDQMWSSPASQA
jgi:chromosome segregation ATPase